MFHWCTTNVLEYSKILRVTIRNIEVTTEKYELYGQLLVFVIIVPHNVPRIFINLFLWSAKFYLGLHRILLCAAWLTACWVTSEIAIDRTKKYARALVSAPRWCFIIITLQLPEYRMTSSCVASSWQNTCENWNEKKEKNSLGPAAVADLAQVRGYIIIYFSDELIWRSAKTSKTFL